MKADKRFLNQPLDFWANIKLISQKAGYTDKKTKQIKIHTLEEIKAVYEMLLPFVASPEELARHKEEVRNRFN